MAKTYTPYGPKNNLLGGKGYVPGPPKGKPAGPGATAGANPAGSPPVPGQPPVGGPPIDPNYEAYVLGANRNITLGNADAAYQKGDLEQTYGYGASGAANPYSRAALLRESFQRAKLGTTNSAGNQIYSGSYRQAQGENQHQYSIAEDANRREYDRSVYGVNYGVAKNASDYGVGMDQATYQRIINALGGS